MALIFTFTMSCTGKPTPEGAHGEHTHTHAPAPASAVEADEPAAKAERAPPPAGQPGELPSAQALAATARGLLDAAGARRAKFAFAFDSADREDWHYVPRSRKGLAIGEMTDAEKSALHELLHAGLSEVGHQKVENIRLIEGILGTLEGNPGFRDPGRYHVVMFGQPGGEAPWSWRFEGHHLSLNFTEADGQVATTPAFFGANPAEVPDGKHRGLRVLAAEEDLGRSLLTSLTGEQRARAILSSSAPSDIVTEASRRVALPHFEGLPAEAMSAEQRAALLHLIEVYVDDLQPDLARAHLERIKAAGMGKIYFAWAGGAGPGESHYYRVHGPTHVIEYDNRGGNHIHTVFRDMEHDFGDGLLARHLREEHAGDKRQR